MGQVVEYIARVRDDATAVFRSEAGALRDAAKAERELAEAARVAASAVGRLEDIAARGNGVEKLALEYRRARAEIASLAEASGDAALAARAHSQLDREFAASMAQRNTATSAATSPLKALTTAAAEAGDSSANLAFQAKNLRYQFADIAVQLQGGINPLVILAQQGPDIAGALGSVSDKGALVKEAFGGIAAGAGAALPVLAGLAVVAATVTAAYAVLANSAQDAYEANDAVADRALAAAAAFKPSADAVAEATKTWEGFRDVVEDTAAELAKVRGELSAGEFATMGRVEQARAAADPGIKAAARTYAALEMERQAQQSIYQDRGRSAEERAAASRRLGELASEIGKSRALLDERKAALDEQIGTILELGAAEDEAAAAAAGKTAADKAATQAARDREKAEKSREEYARTHLLVTEMELAAATEKFDALQLPPLDVSPFEELRRAIEEMVPPSAAEDLERLAAAEREAALAAKQAELASALGRGDISRAEFNQLSGRLATGTQAATTQASQSAALGVAGTVTGAISDPLGAIAGAHPIAAAVVAGVQAAASGGEPIRAIGELVIDAFEGLPKIIDAAADTVVSLLTRALPELMRSLPDITRELVELVPAVIDGLVRGIPLVVTELARAIPAMIPDLAVAFAQLAIGIGPMLVAGIVSAFLDPQFYVAIGDAFLSGLEQMWERFGQLFRDLLDSIVPGDQSGSTGPGLFESGGWLDQAGQDIGDWWSGAFEDGGYVPKTGLALVHAGEYVNSAKQQRGGGGAGPVSVNLSFNSRDLITDLWRSWEFEQGPLGRVA